MKRLAVAALALAAIPNMSLAWGNTGHRIVGQLAMLALPADLPAFLRTRQAVADMGELSREPDRSKGAGRLHDNDRDSAHFLDLGEDGKILGGPAFLPMPANRADYEAGLQAAKIDSWKAGYLQYAIIDRRQQLSLDFAYWRVLKAAEANPKWKAHRAWFRADRIRREGQIMRTLGELSHYVSDGSQPLHVTVHYNGWGDYPNAAGYSKEKLHAPFESDLVQATVSQAAVKAKMAPLRICNCALDKRTTDYLLKTSSFVIPFYEMEKSGGMTDGRATALAVERMAAGASELRDVIVESWTFSATMKVGWRPVAVADVVAGTIDPYPNLYGVD